MEFSAVLTVVSGWLVVESGVAPMLSNLWGKTSEVSRGDDDEEPSQTLLLPLRLSLLPRELALAGACLPNGNDKPGGSEKPGGNNHLGEDNLSSSLALSFFGGAVDTAGVVGVEGVTEAAKARDPRNGVGKLNSMGNELRSCPYCEHGSNPSFESVAMGDVSVDAAASVNAPVRRLPPKLPPTPAVASGTAGFTSTSRSSMNCGSRKYFSAVSGESKVT
jgi:hypothetical protein